MDLLRSRSGRANPMLGVLAVIAIVVAGYFITRSARSGTAGNTADPDRLTIICTGCNAESRMSGADYAGQLETSPDHYHVICPECGKPAARVASQCVNEECGRWYLRPGPDGKGANTCPYCGTPRISAE